MTDRNTNKLILTACCLFGGWMLIHFDAVEGLNNLTNGAFYQTTADHEKEVRAAEEYIETWRSDIDRRVWVRGAITEGEMEARSQRREDQLRQKRIAEGREP